jgi:hypothetical protein
VEIELFPYQPNVPDDEWIPLVGKSHPKRIVLSVDDGQIGNAVQRSYVRDSGCSFVYLAQGWANLEWSVYASKLVRAWPNIVKTCSNLKGHSLVEVSVNVAYLRFTRL